MKNIYKSLANFQQEVPVIHQPTKGYGYTYSDLTTILGVINPLLKKHSLGFTQLLNGQELKTIIFHVESGEQIESIISIPKDVKLKGMNDFQVLGSAITYLRRYSLAGALGLVTDKDADAHGVQEPPKEKLSDARFQIALQKLINKEIKESDITAYDLNESQNKALNDLKNVKDKFKECDATDLDIY